MKLMFYFVCPVLLFVFVNSATMRFKIENFVKVILEIRKFYSAATVIFAHPGDEYGDYGDLSITHLVHTCSRLLGRQYVVTLDIHFRRMHRSLRYYRRIVQPIVIVILPDFNGYLEFAEATKTYYMSFPVWVVLFLFGAANNTLDYCRDPVGNPFNLAFDSQMLVLCDGDGEDILQEWYSVKGDIVKVFDLAKWVDIKGFVPLTNLSLYDRRNDMEGAVLRAVTVKDAPISSGFYHEEDYVSRLYGNVLEELTHSLNFTLEVVSVLNEYGVWNPENSTWSGVMGEIVSGRADFAIAVMPMTSLRVRYVDFTLPLIISGNSLFIKEPRVCGVKWLGYFQTFSLYTWSAIIALIAVMPFLLCFMKTCRGARNIVDLISDNFICIWGIFCQQALTEFPRCSSLRVAYFTIFCTAILITAYYSAALVCFLTACVHVLPFRTMGEFVEDGTYKFIVPRGNADFDIVSTSNKAFSLELMKLMKNESELPTSLIDGFVQICNDRKLAYLVLNALKESVEMSIPCKLSRISTTRIDNIGMILSKCNPYTRVINYHLQKYLDNGMMKRLRNTRFLSPSIQNKAYEPVHVSSIIPILSILCGGIILSFIILATEKVHYWFRRRRENKRRQLKVFYKRHLKKQLLITK